MALTREGYVTSIGNDLVLHDGSKMTKIGKLPGTRSGNVVVLNGIAMAMTPTYTNRRQLWRSDLPVKKWTKLREMKSGEIAVHEGKFVLIDKDKVFHSLDGLDWQCVTKLPFRPAYIYQQDRALIADGISETMTTLNGSSWFLSTRSCFWIDGEPVALQSYTGAFKWKGKVVLHDQYNFCINGEIISHNIGRGLAVVNNDRHVVVSDGYSVYIVTDLMYWKEIATKIDFFCEEDGYVFIATKSKLSLVSTPPWSIQKIAKTLPAQRRYHRNLLLSFQRWTMTFPLFMEVIRLI